MCRWLNSAVGMVGNSGIQVQVLHCSLYLSNNLDSNLELPTAIQTVNSQSPLLVLNNPQEHPCKVQRSWGLWGLGALI
ncbi:hypothetical protein IC582_012599 [Cucumis melo]